MTQNCPACAPTPLIKGRGKILPANPAPTTPPPFVLRGDKLIPGRLISRGTRRPPNFAQDVCSGKRIYRGESLENKIYLLHSSLVRFGRGGLLGESQGYEWLASNLSEQKKKSFCHRGAACDGITGF